MNVKSTVRVPHWIPMKSRVGEPLCTWDGANTHERGHHTSSLQAADTVNRMMHACHAHGHRHGRGWVECGGRRCLRCRSLDLLRGSLRRTVRLLLPLLFHFNLTAFFLICDLVLLLQSVSIQPTIYSFKASWPHVR